MRWPNLGRTERLGGQPGRHAPARLCWDSGIGISPGGEFVYYSRRGRGSRGTSRRSRIHSLPAMRAAKASRDHPDRRRRDQSGSQWSTRRQRRPTGFEPPQLGGLVRLSRRNRVAIRCRRPGCLGGASVSDAEGPAAVGSGGLLGRLDTAVGPHGSSLSSAPDRGADYLRPCATPVRGGTRAFASGTSRFGRSPGSIGSLRVPTAGAAFPSHFAGTAAMAAKTGTMPPKPRKRAVRLSHRRAAATMTGMNRSAIPCATSTK